ncbi:carnitine O-palmitoyltransferase 1, brain isoform-like [Octopus sinensis]|uniref:Carnitine O-palmitoyltransferase 1, brain isoform-like n=1 Tax=Octopus sinensis TaxID=2607531 RepID=A0A7E6EJT4_9MOLL|nr:carnitine O-palmitoyltransferase 1, brain isoform-like [Octopus sinensis]
MVGFKLCFVCFLNFKVSDWWEEFIYLVDRSSIVINSNYYTLGLAGYSRTMSCRQASRAAGFVSSLLAFRRSINTENLKPAAFHLVLEDFPAELEVDSDSEQLSHISKRLFHGKGYDRWFEKSFNLVVFSDGHNESLKRLAYEAINSHQRVTKMACTGMGIDRHLFALFIVSRFLVEKSEFLECVLQETWGMSTSQVKHISFVTIRLQFLRLLIPRFCT